jgi:Na+-driven multidrug efflux pump
VSNFVLNWFLVLGLAGFPAMGVAGSALSTVIAQALGGLLVLVHVYRAGYVQRYGLFRREALDSGLLRRLMALSGPTMLQYLLSMGGFLYLAYEIEKLGETALAASELVKTAYLTLMIPSWGFQAAASTLVSYVIGAGHPAAVGRLAWRIALQSLWAALGLSLFLFAFPRLTFQLYTSDPALIQQAIGPGYMVGIGLLLFSIGGIYLNAVIGTGATRFALAAELGTITAYCLTIYLLRVYSPGLMAYWSAELAYMGGMVLTTWLYLRSKRWMRLRAAV